jgi:3-isopropylmalate dehydratase small subunit
MNNSEKINILLAQQTQLLVQMQAQQVQMQAQQVQMQAQQVQMQAQQQTIDEMTRLISTILINTDKMGRHIDFINNAYEKISKSYFFKNLLG